QRALDHRRTDHRDVERAARGQNELLAEALRVAVRIRPSPAQRTLLADLLEFFLDPSLAAMLRSAGLIAVRLLVLSVALKLAAPQLIMRFRLDPRDRRERVAN